jgi:hypothetical protein
MTDLTVKVLIKYLEMLDPDLKVGRVGHYGEFYPMDLLDFSDRVADMGGAFSYRRGKKRAEKVLAISPPDIGPEPD